MRAAAILVLGATLATAQNGIQIPTDLAGASSLFNSFFPGVPIPTNAAEASAIANSILGTDFAIPTNPAEASSFASSLRNTLPTISAADDASSAVSSIRSAATNPASSAVTGNTQSSSTGGVAPMQTGLGLLLAGMVGAGVAAIAL